MQAVYLILGVSNSLLYDVACVIALYLILDVTICLLYVICVIAVYLILGVTNSLLYVTCVIL